MRHNSPSDVGPAPIRRMRHVLLGLVAMGVASFSAGSGRLARAESPRTLFEHQPQPLARIAPGWEVAAEPAAPWTHLVIYSRPRLADAEAEKVYPLVARLATLLSTTIVAEVGLDSDSRPARHVLRQVGIGLASRVDGREVIVSSTTEREQRAALGFLGNLLLSQSEERLADIRQTARTPTMALVDAPGIMLRAGQHADVLLRYALLVDPRQGTLTTLLWLLEPTAEKGWRLIEPICRLLSPGLVEDCRLHVDGQEITAGVPSARAFAIVTPPPGKVLALPPAWAALAAQVQFSHEQVASLEQGLRELLRARRNSTAPPMRTEL